VVDAVKDEKIKSPVCNYYGRVICVREGDEYFMCLDDYDSTVKAPITKAFYRAFKKQFGKKKGE
jgi:hypothetical protein